MGDIADIEKKKSMGISNLILGNNKAGGPTVAGNVPIAKRKSDNTEHEVSNNAALVITIIS